MGDTEKIDSTFSLIKVRQEKVSTDMFMSLGCLKLEETDSNVLKRELI